MRYAHILSRVTSTLWLIEESSLANLMGLLEARINSQPSAVGSGGEDRAPQLAGRQGDAIIPIHGIIGKRLSAMETACGATDVDRIRASIDKAVTDPSVNRIVLHVDSPGGAVTGVPELASHIRAVGEKKRIIAVTDTTMGSAAYWLASGASAIIATPTARVGSIGVVLAVKEAVADPSDGKTRLRVFRSGKHKLMGSDGPLTEEQASAMQASVDELGGEFRAFVTNTREDVKPDSMEGLAYFGKEAQARGLVTRVVATVAEALG